MQETISYPVVSNADLTKTHGGGEEKALRLTNPINSQHQFMRTSLRSGVLKILEASRSYDRGPIAIFESGRIYFPRDNDLPEEKEMIVGLLNGPRARDHWLMDQGQLGFYDAKGILDSLFETLGVDANYHPGGDRYLHPTRSASIVSSDTNIGVLGELHPTISKEMGSVSPIYIFDLDIPALLTVIPNRDRQFQSLGRFPPAVRDLSIVVNSSISAGHISDCIKEEQLVHTVTLFDVFDGEGIPKDNRSLTYRIEFQSEQRTLTSDEVGHALDKVTRQVLGKFNARLRG
jgi:phenylalanyl-tRNA synthetase beta chain